MATPVLNAAEPLLPREVFHEAKGLAESLPDLLMEARRVANTILAGWHGRRRAGPGETFWQFRPFVFGEPAGGIDWRRSAHDDHLYVRDTEWEAAHTVWLAPDLSASMAFRSRHAAASKRDRTAVATLAIAELLARAGERVGLLGSTRPILSRNAPERLSRALPTHGGAELDLRQLRHHSDLVVISDFLDGADVIEARIAAIAATGARAHLLQVVDPVEETFPFGGRTEFVDPETGTKVTVGRAEAWRAAYQQRLASLRDRLRLHARRLDWTFLVHRTDRPATEPLLALHARLTDRGLRRHAHALPGTFA
ncbi:MAG: DUF58 domain-containing protein [Bauldia sp.]|nr:DUF58 domain-containing protein [Bauldia sp.]